MDYLQQPPVGSDGYLVLIVYGVDYQGISSCLLPTLSRLSVSCGPGCRFRHRCSSRYLRISPLHLEFRTPLPHSSTAVQRAVPGLSPGISHAACGTAYAPFMPSESEQRSPPSYYRSCWHEVSQGSFFN